MIGILALAVLVLQGSARTAQTGAPSHPSSPQSPQGPVQLGVSVTPDSVTVGEHFLVAVRVRAPRGARITFAPASADSAQSIEAVDPPVIRANPDTTVAEQTAIYRMVAWDTGGVAVEIGDATVSVGREVRSLPIPGSTLFVRSVLPADTTLHVPKPARDILALPLPWWRFWPWLLAGLLLLIGLGLLYWWWRRRRARGEATPADPYAEAEREFAHIDSLGLLEAGERGRYVALNVEVLRAYLEARVTPAHRSLTTSELLASLREQPRVPLDPLAAVLSDADLVKFARRNITDDRARALGEEARTIVRTVETQLSGDGAEVAKRAA